MFTSWLDRAIDAFTRLFPEYTFFNFSYNVTGLLAVILVCLICGAVGSLVVGNRMAFFSDALAHCAFAGITLGFLIALLSGVQTESEFYAWATPVMVIFGMLVGVGIAYVREQTALASDTVIGVFFAGALGFGAVLLKGVSRRRYFSPENFLFGDPLAVSSGDLVLLFLLTLLTFGLLIWMYNYLVFASFNPSLALSRRIPIRLCNYLFIVLLALIVNLCIKTVGVLLINALLVVPAATASNLSRNMRQLFWRTVGVCLLVGVMGVWIAWSVKIPDPGGKEPIPLGTAGTMVVLSVLLFFASMVIGPRLRGWSAKA